MAQTALQSTQSNPNDPTGVSQTPLTLGPIVFRREECPKKIAGLGGIEQMTAVTPLAGGGLVNQGFGAQPKTVSWTATFWKNFVQQRVVAIRSMITSGSEYDLSWINEKYRCKVKSIDPGYRNAFRAEYEITVEITQALNGALSAPSQTTIDQQVSAISAQIDNELANISVGDANAPAALPVTWSAAKQSIQNAGPLGQLTGQNLTSTLNTIAGALSVAQTYAGGLLVTSPTFMAAAQTVSLMTLLNKNISAGQSPQSITVMGGTLAEIASSHYNNVDLAPALMAANGLPSIFLPAATPTTITLPPFPVSQ